MNDNQRFDDHIKEQFNDYSPDVHPRIWENIVKQREKRKPAGFWFTLFNGRNILLLAVLLLATGSGAYFLLKPSSTNDTTIAGTTANTLPATQKNNGGNSNEPAGTISANNTNNADAGSSGTAQNNTTVINNDADINTNDITNNVAGKSTFRNSGASKIKIYSPGTQAADDIVKTKSNKHNSSNSADEYDITNETIGDQNTEDLYLKRLLFDGLQTASAQKKTADLNKRFSINVFLPDCPSVEKNAAGNKTYVEIYGGPDFALRSMSDTGNSAYLQKRKESTKFASAFSAGIRYTKVFNNGMSVRTGVNYSQINEKFTFTQGNLVQVTYIIDANGDTTGSYVTTGTRYKTTTNRFKTIDVPLLIGYELGNGRIHANINAGVIVNIYSWQKGDVLDASFKPVSITTGKSNSPYQFKTNIGMGFMAGASVYYKLTEKAHVLAEPYFRYNLSPMSSDKLTFSQKYNTIGLRIGLRVDLR
jgi:hypothetical protein